MNKLSRFFILSAVAVFIMPVQSVFAQSKTLAQYTSGSTLDLTIILQVQKIEESGLLVSRDYDNDSNALDGFVIGLLNGDYDSDQSLGRAHVEQYRYRVILRNNAEDAATAKINWSFASSSNRVEAHIDMDEQLEEAAGGTIETHLIGSESQIVTMSGPDEVNCSTDADTEVDDSDTVYGSLNSFSETNAQYYSDSSDIILQEYYVKIYFEEDATMTYDQILDAGHSATLNISSSASFVEVIPD